MSDYCLFPSQCGPGMDCSGCMALELGRRSARIAELEARLADAELRLGDPRDIPCDTGHPDADRVISGLCSDYPQFHTMEDAAVLIRRLVADAQGPDGFASWKDAAVHERQTRVAMEARLAAAERDSERLDWVEVNEARISVRSNGRGHVRWEQGYAESLDGIRSLIDAAIDPARANDASL